MKPFDWTRFFSRPYGVYTQLLFWVAVFFLYILLKEYPPRMTGLTLVCLVLQETLELAIPCYTQNLLVLPLLQRRKWLMGGILYLLQLAALILLLPYLLNGVGQLFAGLFSVRDLVDWRKEHIAFSVVAFTVIATFTKTGLDHLKREKEQKENELRHLKAQLNPHFLFNTLNNLYGLAVRESRELPGLMLQLSDLLRYSLYDTGQPYVNLQKELTYITGYVELEQIRLTDSADIRLEICKDNNEQYIAPLLLIVFFENAFKHFSAVKDSRPYIHMRLSVRDGCLHLNLRNSVDPGNSMPPAAKRKGGLGLNNARQRLNLIYPDQHRLEIRKGADFFEIDLNLELT